MATDAEHAARVIEFHKSLLQGGLSEDVAGVVTIDFNKVVLTGDPPTAPVGDAKAELAEAAEQRRQRRAEELARAEEADR